MNAAISAIGTVILTVAILLNFVTVKGILTIRNRLDFMSGQLEGIRLWMHVHDPHAIKELEQHLKESTE